MQFGYKLWNGKPYPYLYNGDYTNPHGVNLVPNNFLKLNENDQKLSLDQLSQKYPYETKQ